MESNSSVLKHRNKTILLKEWNATELKLTKAERLILAARLKGMSFSQLEEKNRKYAIDDLIIECASIHGCHLPTTEFYADRITSSLSSFILDFDYGDLTCAEMILALRLNIQGLLQIDDAVIQFSGVTVNVSFFAMILKRYMITRNIIDGKIKNKIDGCEY